jgi:hypothetical protein
MKTTHLSPWEQEECVIDRPTPQMHRHLNECGECRGAVESLQRSAEVFRGAAMEWSAENLAARPRQLLVAAGATRPVAVLRWAIAGILPLVLMVLVFLGIRSNSRPVGPVAAINTAGNAAKAEANTDDALLEQVDEQLSVTVPASMESLTHLVSAGSGAGGDMRAQGGKPVVQTN